MNNAICRLTGCELDQLERRVVIGPLEHREVGDDDIDHIAPGQRQGAGRDDLGAAVLGGVFHHHDDLLDPGNQVHRPAHALDHLARDHPVGDVAVFGDFHRAEHGQIDLAAANHREAGGAVKIGRVRQLADGLLAGVDQIGIDLVLGRERPDPEHAVLALQRHGNALGNMVRHQCRNTNAKIDVVTIAQFLRGAGRHLVAAPALGDVIVLGH